MTKFIEKSYMVASILKINRDYLHKNYVTKRQLNVLTWYIQKLFNEKNIDAIFVDYIDAGYFKDYGDIVVLQDSYIYDFDGVLTRYQGFLPFEILSILWDEEFMLKIITEDFQNILKENVKTLFKGL